MPRAPRYFQTAVTVLLALPVRCAADDLRCGLPLLAVPFLFFLTVIVALLQILFIQVLRKPRSATVRVIVGLIAVGSLTWDGIAAVTLFPARSEWMELPTTFRIWFGVDVLLIAGSFALGIRLLARLRRANAAPSTDVSSLGKT